MLSPGRRSSEPSRLTARRLTLKAASRLRRGGYATRRLVLHARFEASKRHWRQAHRIPRTQDSFSILRGLDALWRRLGEAAAAEPGGFALRMVGVALEDLDAEDGEQGSLFGALAADDPLARETRNLSLSRAMDVINQRFGRNAVMLGPVTGGRIDRVGTSIAFGRIPDAAEFHE